jgi:transcriptional regulator GlxA family with amidase domain
MIIHDGVQALDVAGALDVFAEANGFIAAIDRYRTVVIGPRGPIRASNGLQLKTDEGFDDAVRVFDTVLVAGGPGMPNAPADVAMCDWMTDWGVQAPRYGSICTGAFALGHAGLLDGRTATTHWHDAAQLAAMFPKARVEHDRIYLRDGPMVTSAGVTAGIDLALALVTEDHGSAVALACAKRLVVAAHRRGGQSQFGPFLLPPPTADSPVAKVLAYVMENLAEAYPVERLAEISGASTRSVARMFATELGVTPHEFIESVRIDNARNRLESSDLALKAIAFDCGFGSAEQMRQVFQRRLGVNPAIYRDSFRSAEMPLGAGPEMLSRASRGKSARPARPSRPKRASNVPTTIA